MAEAALGVAYDRIPNLLKGPEVPVDRLAPGPEPRRQFVDRGPAALLQDL